MKCQVCQRRKARHVRQWDLGDRDIHVCEKCRRIHWPTSEEELQDAQEEEYRAERSAELAAYDYEMRY